MLKTPKMEIIRVQKQNKFAHRFVVLPNIGNLDFKIVESWDEILQYP
jgi:hypothetical protein